MSRDKLFADASGIENEGEETEEKDKGCTLEKERELEISEEEDSIDEEIDLSRRLSVDNSCPECAEPLGVKIDIDASEQQNWLRVMDCPKCPSRNAATKEDDELSKLTRQFTEKAQELRAKMSHDLSHPPCENQAVLELVQLLAEVYRGCSNANELSEEMFCSLVENGTREKTREIKRWLGRQRQHKLALRALERDFQRETERLDAELVRRHLSEVKGKRMAAEFERRRREQGEVCQRLREVLELKRREREAKTKVEEEEKSRRERREAMRREEKEVTFVLKPGFSTCVGEY